MIQLPAPVNSPSQPNSGLPEFARLIRAAQSGDRDARDTLLRHYAPTIRSRVHAQMRRELHCKRRWLTQLFSTGDVVQEVLIAVVHDLKDFETLEEPAFLAYLSALVRNRLSDAIRFHEAHRRDARRQREGEPDLLVPNDSRTPSQLAEQRDTLEVFARVLASFSERDAALLRGRLDQRTEFPALAEQLGYHTPDAARKAFYLAQARLICRLRDAGIDQSDA